MTNTDELRSRISDVIDQVVRPTLQANGGDIELLGLDGGIVQVRLLGTCRGCPSTTMSIVMGIEQQLRESVPEVDYMEVTG